MSLLRVFPGANDKELRLRQLINYVVASPEKQVWQGLFFEKTPNMVRASGVPAEGTTEEILMSFLLPHMAYGYPGTRLCYHCLLDFNGLLGANDAGYIAWEINEYLRTYGVQFLQGVHITKKGGLIFWPHVHVLINSIVLYGPDRGRKFRMEKPVLRGYKEYMNAVLKKYKLPVIPVYEGGGNDEITNSEP